MAAVAVEGTSFDRANPGVSARLSSGPAVDISGIISWAKPWWSEVVSNHHVEVYNALVFSFVRRRQYDRPTLQGVLDYCVLSVARCTASSRVALFETQWSDDVAMQIYGY